MLSYSYLWYRFEIEGGHNISYMNTIQILGIGASPRKDGNTDILLDEFLKGAKSAGATTKKIFLRDCLVNSCIGCEACRKTGTCSRFHDDMEAIYPLIDSSEGIVMGSPTYNYNITAMLKAFIDRLYCFYEFSDQRPGPYSSKLADRGKKALVFSVCEQVKNEEMGFELEAMARPLEALGYEIFDKYRSSGYFEKGVVSEDNTELQRAFEAGRKLAILLIDRN